MKITSAKIILAVLISAYAAVTGACAATPKFEHPLAGEAFAYFLEALKIPRGSGNERAISDYLAAFAKERQLDVVQDEALNVLIRKPGSSGRENEPPLILQAHMDIVCESNEGTEHDFLKDPIIPVIEGDWIRAEGTTLGADDASGLSIIMAVLASNKLSHPPIEAVITTEEETTMGGAVAFDVSLLEGKRFINLDYEDEGIFCVSCASTTAVVMSIPIVYEPAPKGYVTYALMVKGLEGGHSGVDIDKGRANANILMARILNELKGKIRLTSIDGGAQNNSITRENKAVISFAGDSLAEIESFVAQTEKNLKAEYPFDEDLTITLSKTEAKDVMTVDSAQKVIAGILFTPFGVLSMSPHIEGLVQTSNNLGIIETEGDMVKLSSLLRSSSITEQDFVIEKFELLTSVLDVKVKIDKESPPWAFKENSPLRDKMLEVFKEFYGREPQVAAVHAGLECAIFAQKIPDGEFVAYGPDIRYAHSPDEKMSLSSFDRTCGYIARLLEGLKN